MENGGGKERKGIRTGEKHEFLSEAEATVGAQDGDGVDVAPYFVVFFVCWFVVISVEVR
jgi:hypothetical protein